MRYGILADVHGNWHALQAALETLRRLEVTEILCAGDLVGYGPMPNECVTTIAGLGARCVAGNHDLMALGRLGSDDCAWLAQKTLAWTSAKLAPTTRRYLEQLPLQLSTADGVVLAHGSLLDPWTYVHDAEQHAAELRALAHAYPAASILVIGHTHVPALHGSRSGPIALAPETAVDLPPGQSFVLNPGSVGQSRSATARARFIVLDTERRQATYYARRFDARACRRALRRQGLPVNAYHPTRPGVRRYASRVRALARRFRARSAVA
jgi:predicted phosphodiesterase